MVRRGERGWKAEREQDHADHVSDDDSSERDRQSRRGFTFLCEPGKSSVRRRKLAARRDGGCEGGPYEL